MSEKFNALLAQNTWTLVPLPSNKLVIGYKWAFRVMQNANGSVARYKAQLVRDFTKLKA